MPSLMRLSVLAAGLFLAQQASAFVPRMPTAPVSRVGGLCAAADGAATDVPLELVKKLRGMSGAPIMDCKKALQAEDLDVEKAFDWLRKKGQASVAKRDRATKEGLVALQVDGNRAVAVEVNSETDFVARNADFQAFVSAAANSALGLCPSAGGVSDIDKDTLLKANTPSGNNVETELANLIAKIRENMALRRASALVVDQGVIGAYVHNSAAPLMGQAGAAVAIRTDATGDKLTTVEGVAKKLAMHVVAASPLYLDPSSVPADAVQREKEILREQAAGSNKPADVVEKMVEGRLRKYFAEVTLIEQNHMVEAGNPRIADLLEETGKSLGCKVELAGFLKYRTGEE